MAKYRVVGDQPVDGVPTGGTVELNDADAARLLAGGHVEAIATRPSKPNTPSSKEDD